MKKHFKKIIAGCVVGFLALGMFNAFILNTHSELSGDLTFVKRLDEMYGITQPGRVVATNSTWEKIEKPEIKENRDIAAVDSQKIEEPGSAIGEDLDLDLVEVVNPKLWSRGLTTTDFSGSLETSNGTIQSLSIALPNREEIEISFAEMKGNVFEYDYSGEIYSGMLYQVDPKSYMVTLTNGPLEGTRLRFVEEFTPEQVEIKDTLKSEHNVDVGFFGGNEKKQIKKTAPADPSFVKAQMTNLGNEAT